MGMCSFFSLSSLLAEGVRIRGLERLDMRISALCDPLRGFLRWLGVQPLRWKWKEGKADGAVVRLSTVGRVALRRFCPTYGLKRRRLGWGRGLLPAGRL
jgi:hypothetical protein